MGIEFHNYVSPYSFVMGVLWFTAFILLGLLMRKLKFPIIFSVVPLLLLLVLSVLRIFIMVEIPFGAVIFSETIYPAVVNFFRIELVSPINIAHIFIFVWASGAVWLTVRFAYEYIYKFHQLMEYWEALPRDEHAESLLREIIGSEKKFCVFRSAESSRVVATAIRPYIILPEIEFTDDELRVVMLHEWKHIRDKDHLTSIVIEIISFVFWWNPIVYILKRNFKFAKELKCDGFATNSKQEFHYLLDGLSKLHKARREREQSLTVVDTLVGKKEELVDRLTVIAMRWEEPHHKWRILTNIGYSVVIVLLFFASYAFAVLPIIESPYVSAPAEDFYWEDIEYGDVFRMAEMEIFLVDNEDGTFSYYVDGVFIMYLDYDHDFLQWVEIRARD